MLGYMNIKYPLRLAITRCLNKYDNTVISIYIAYNLKLYITSFHILFHKNRINNIIYFTMILYKPLYYDSNIYITITQLYVSTT